jgi:aryl-alcohol dehydrogenase-like predicted oxidoreductase
MSTLASELGRTNVGLSIGYALAQPWIHAVVVGIRSAEQLAGVAGECARAPLTADGCARVASVLPAGSPNLVNPACWPQLRRPERKRDPA